MQRHGAFPAEAGEEGDTVIFLILREGLKVSRDEIGKGEEGQWNGEDEEAMSFVRLKREGDGGNYVSNLRGEEKFSPAAIGKVEGRDGKCEDKDEGEN